MFVSLKDLLPSKIDQSYVMSVIEGGGWVASASNASLYFEDDQDRKRIGAWCASSRDPLWIKIDLERVKQITAIATQGNTVMISSGSPQKYKGSVKGLIPLIRLYSQLHSRSREKRLTTSRVFPFTSFLL